MNKEMLKMDHATRTTERLAQSIHIMEQLKKISANQQMNQTKKRFEDSMYAGLFKDNVAPKKQQIQIFNDKAAN